MLKCREVSFLLSEAQDRPLSVGEALQLRIHLLMCKKCSNFARQLKVIRLACQKKANDEDLH
ncbi:MULTISPECIES: zf-HC2 domain-containing protein [Deefgea]|uniref:Zf-HC2 domain-containing protein n=1 Tax=Deefgea chitinilytica TaxID=570276 RepID=A0ABS2CDL3_9NEIS|nr:MULTISPECIES: zf-HC2 domain-containing protein [Deefgea]MBM5572233.1 zf-HC2 domain-containing protein [Deefgea chitinilytica]MBM9889468.1 zf-HC2 domain-containing protein [Deefgea sp. CFH1-16]